MEWGLPWGLKPKIKQDYVIFSQDPFNPVAVRQPPDAAWGGIASSFRDRGIVPEAQRFCRRGFFYVCCSRTSRRRAGTRALPGQAR
jgi:hypothetical protein